MYFNPWQPPAQTYVPSLSWVLRCPAAPGLNGARNHIKNLPSLSKVLWDPWIFLHQTYIFFFQKWEDEEHDTLVVMGTQREACVHCSPSCKQALVALETGVSSTDGIHPGLSHMLSQGVWVWGVSPTQVTRGRSEGASHCKVGSCVWQFGGKFLSPGWNFCCKTLKIVRGSPQGPISE